MDCIICLYFKYLFLKTFESDDFEKITLIPKSRNLILCLLFRIKFFVFVECRIGSLDFCPRRNKYLYTCLICLSKVSNSGSDTLNFLITSITLTLIFGHRLHELHFEFVPNTVTDIRVFPLLLALWPTKSDIESALLSRFPMFSCRPGQSHFCSCCIFPVFPRTCFRSSTRVSRGRFRILLRYPTGSFVILQRIYFVVVASEVLIAEGVIQIFDQFVVENVVFGQFVVRCRRQLVATRAHRRIMKAEIAGIVIPGHILQKFFVIIFL